MDESNDPQPTLRDWLETWQAFGEGRTVFWGAIAGLDSPMTETEFADWLQDQENQAFDSWK